MFVKFLTHGLFPILLDSAGEGTEGGGGGGGEPAKTLTQEEVNKLLAAERRKLEKQIKDLESRASDSDTAKAELAKLREEKELAGKSEIEKLQRKYDNDVAALKKEIADKDGTAKSASEQLHNERVATRLVAALGKANVMPQFLGKAAKLAHMELEDIKVSEDGVATASYNDLIDKPLPEVVAAWIKDNENFLPPPVGGGGTRGSSGSALPANLWDMEPRELVKLDQQQRSGK
jgi:hypothetical protein